MARVTIIDPTVSTNAVKLRVGVYATTPTAQAVVSYARATETNVTPIVATEHVVLASELDYILLTVGAYLDTSGRFQYQADIALVLDTLAITVGKAAADIASVVDRIATTDVGKYVSDPVSAVDVLTALVSWNRTFTDLAPAIDAQYKAISLGNPIEATNRYVLEGYVFDGYVAVDSVFTATVLSGIIQSYVSGDYFAEDYVGATFGPY